MTRSTCRAVLSGALLPMGFGLFLPLRGESSAAGGLLGAGAGMGLLGDDLLVAPVIEEGATSREVYLPPGTWFHVWTGATHEGGQTITIDAPIGSPPVFSRGTDRADLRALWME